QSKDAALAAARRRTLRRAVTHERGGKIEPTAVAVNRSSSENQENFFSAFRRGLPRSRNEVFLVQEWKGWVAKRHVLRLDPPSIAARSRLAGHTQAMPA
ncbi:hypothetical protein CKO51_09925, partial [Rhodopirellula sp. SM50]